MLSFEQMIFSEEGLQPIEEMPIQQFKQVGDWTKASSFRDKTDRALLSSPKAVEKIKRQWEKTPFDFDIYVVNDKRVNKSEFREVGLVDWDFVRNNMKITPEEIPDPVGDVITIIYTNNAGDERYMASGWILAHRLGHAFARKGTGRDTVKFYWDEFTNNLRRRVTQVLMNAYGIDLSFRGWRSNKNDKEKMLKYVAQQLGTMKSARDSKMRNWFEFAYELLAQYLITGKVKFNPLPESLIVGMAGWGRKDTRYVKSKEELRYFNEEELQGVTETIEYELESILGAAVGSVFVM
jgi:hypothetical protein